MKNFIITAIVSLVYGVICYIGGCWIGKILLKILFKDEEEA